MEETTERRGPARAEERDGETQRRERAEAAEAEWVLERIQQTFNAPGE